MAEHSTLGQNVPKSPAPPEGLFLMDGIEGLRSLPQHSVDMLLTDPPYGTTRNFWDVPLPLPELWEAVRWAVKPEGAVLFFAQCPYDKVLGASNLPMLRYEWVWYKSRCTGFLNARRAPLKRTENILVFYQKLPYYDPQFEQGKPYKKTADRGGNSPNYGKFVRSGGGSEDGLRFPGNLLTFPSVQRTVHPTQKPVELCEYFIKTYTRPGEVVADSWFYGLGFWTRGNAEICLLATRGHPKRQATNIHQFIISPVEAHSKKPDEARDKIVSLLGDLPRVELFARQTPPGWDVWGNEVESTVPDFGTLCPKVGGPKGGLSCPM